MMEELCPDAWAISYVNPTNMVADAVRRQTKVKFIAICDCFPSFVAELAQWLGVPLESVRARAMGVNHLTWLISFLVRGQDGYPLIEAKIRDQAPHWADELGFAARLYDTYGYLMVCPSHPRMLWEHDSELAKVKAFWEDPDLHGWPASLARVWEYVEELIAGAPYDETQSHMAMHHARHAVGLMVSIITNDGREWGGINMPNRGAISNLPSEAIVEASYIVDARGPVPIAMGDLPKPFVGLTQHIINWQELTVDAALSGDRRILYQALLASPYVHDMKAARAIMEELLVAHAEYMPQFKK
jgi:6-phospho-beta-glucosidase